MLRLYKGKHGEVNYPAVLSIPKDRRLPEIAQNDYKGLVAVTSAAITLALESMNLKRSMNAIQILDLTETIIDSSSEDYLAMEDVMLFLQKLVRGEYGAMYESMDIPKFMLAFETYRQERHSALKSIQENKHLEYKGMGDSERTNVQTDLEKHFAGMSNQMSGLKSRIAEQQEIINSMKMDKE